MVRPGVKSGMCMQEEDGGVDKDEADADPLDMEQPLQLLEKSLHGTNNWKLDGKNPISQYETEDEEGTAKGKMSHSQQCDDMAPVFAQ